MELYWSRDYPDLWSILASLAPCSLFKLDDLFSGITGIIWLVNTILTTIIIRNQATIDDVAALKLAAALSLTFWTTLYSVKASFLVLIYSIFRPSSMFRKLWWVLTIYTFATFVIIFLSEFWQCGDPSEYADPAACLATSVDSNKLWSASLWFRAFFHISCDCFILILPLAYIGKFHMSTLKKVSTAATFAISIVDIILGILKNVAILSLQSDSESLQYYGDMATVCSVLEPAIAVMVCAMPVYRVLLPHSRREQRYLRQKIKGNAVAHGRGPKPRIALRKGITDTTTDDGTYELLDSGKLETRV